MAVKLRLKRFGRRHCSTYRLAAVDSRRPRDGRVIEELGFYRPAGKGTAAQATLEVERIRHWLSVGAQPTETVGQLLKQHGITSK